MYSRAAAEEEERRRQEMYDDDNNRFGGARTIGDFFSGERTDIYPDPHVPSAFSTTYEVVPNNNSSIADSASAPSRLLARDSAASARFYGLDSPVANNQDAAIDPSLLGAADSNQYINAAAEQDAATSPMDGATTSADSVDINASNNANRTYSVEFDGLFSEDEGEGDEAGEQLDAGNNANNTGNIAGARVATHAAAPVAIMSPSAYETGLALALPTGGDVPAASEAARLPVGASSYGPASPGLFVSDEDWFPDPAIAGTVSASGAPGTVAGASTSSSAPSAASAPAPPAPAVASNYDMALETGPGLSRVPYMPPLPPIPGPIRGRGPNAGPTLRYRCNRCNHTDSRQDETRRHLRAVHYSEAYGGENLMDKNHPLYHKANYQARQDCLGP
ncbi:hypothetical protein CTRI78_v005699 [Colletotrichum trifolii]|uniref:C2H2-type domain-containing protein n=1 Tax=Colletotrichum trifolii TaxID=5466 RepID=A0A4R8RHH2_COLTR|nr:hypothetical protein CTRI78_v005699 [Colletotrichum trifolii]